MSLLTRIIIVFLSLLLLIIIVRLIISKKLQIEYSILWLTIGIVIFSLTSFVGLFDNLTELIGIGHAPSFYFFIAIIFLMLVNLHLSVKLSKFTNQIKELTQQQAIASIERSEKNKNEDEIIKD
jgi:hypothetical protein